MVICESCIHSPVCANLSDLCALDEYIEKDLEKREGALKDIFSVSIDCRFYISNKAPILTSGKIAISKEGT